MFNCKIQSRHLTTDLFFILVSNHQRCFWSKPGFNTFICHSESLIFLSFYHHPVNGIRIIISGKNLNFRSKKKRLNSRNCKISWETDADVKSWVVSGGWWAQGGASMLLFFIGGCSSGEQLRQVKPSNQEDRQFKRTTPSNRRPPAAAGKPLRPNRNKQPK